MIPPATPKACMACGKSVKGRSDKKFCDDYCRNAFNNQLKGGENNYIRNINNILRKNRRILENCFAEGDAMAKASREKLLRQGFQFNYNTHTYTNKKGAVYVFCYDYGYLALEKGWYLLVKRMKE